MPTLTDHAICIRLLDWSETSQIVVLLTNEHGKVPATAKGSKRRTPSTLHKFSGGVELLTAGEAVLILKPRTELANLIEWDLRDPHPGLRRNLRAHRLGMYAADLAHHLLAEHDPHPATFAALWRLLRDLGEPGGLDSSPSRGSREAALLRFQWMVIEDAGYRPILENDAQTDKALDPDARTLAFSPSFGGVVTDTGAGDRWRMRPGTLDALRAAAYSEQWEAIGREDLERANRLLCAYVRSLLDRELPTMSYIL